MIKQPSFKELFFLKMVDEIHSRHLHIRAQVNELDQHNNCLECNQNISYDKCLYLYQLIDIEKSKYFCYALFWKIKHSNKGVVGWVVVTCCKMGQKVKLLKEILFIF